MMGDAFKLAIQHFTVLTVVAYLATLVSGYGGLHLPASTVESELVR